MTEVAQEQRQLHSFRDDLRQPKVTFARCCITGEWGKTVSIDLGDISIDTPEPESAVQEPGGGIRFTKVKRVPFEVQGNFSRAGLEMLMSFMDSQDNPIPKVTPVLVYKWMLLYHTGAGLCQFEVNPETYEEVEVCSDRIDWDKVATFSIVPNSPAVQGVEGLPHYTISKATGRMFRDSDEIDLEYDGAYPADVQLVYARKVNITMASTMRPNGLDRNITPAHTSVLQLMGWKVGGLSGPGPGRIIAIDEQGNWRPYEYTGE